MYNVDIYDGFAHWHKPIEEISESFETEKQAIEYAKLVKEFKPNCVAWIWRD